MQVLSVPFTQLSYAGLSPDGRWIVFPAPDARNRWDYYYMHVSGSDPRRITTDSISTGVDLEADISPDGSQVAFSCYSEGGMRQICVTSVLGGVRRILAVPGNLPRWRPDGHRVGYVRLVNGTARMFWSVKPDGSDTRLEFTDSLTHEGRYSFAWSPDGKSVAWIRTFKEGHQEIVTRNIVTGEERQLTSDRGNIDDVYWSKMDMIVFSSNRSGNPNLWVGDRISASACLLTEGNSCTFSSRTSETSGLPASMVPPRSS
jgi:Tol biopolymer transport system component